jgi:hypothetical protein
MASGSEGKRFKKFVRGTRATFLGAPKTIAEALIWAGSGAAGTYTVGQLVLELVSKGVLEMPLE